MLGKRQRQNGLATLHGVQERAARHGWDQWEAHHMAIVTIQCCLTESNLHNYGNTGISDSYRLADPVPRILRPVLGPLYLGSDHASVGVFQQQVPMWGTTEDCMDPKKACHKFMSKAADVGMDVRNGLPNRLDIQRVQVSFDPNGFNYRAQRLRARLFVARHWDMKAKRVKEGHR